MEYELEVFEVYDDSKTEKNSKHNRKKCKRKASVVNLTGLDGEGQKGEALAGGGDARRRSFSLRDSLLTVFGKVFIGRDQRKYQTAVPDKNDSPHNSRDCFKSFFGHALYEVQAQQIVNRIDVALAIAGSDCDKKTHRRIRANDKEYNSQFRYANNLINTSKYTVLTFLPLNLFEQFQRLANFYFLCLLVLQLIPVISSLTPITTALPLIGVLALTAVKDAYDDYQRWRSDSHVNNRSSRTVRSGRLVNERWANVQVGDIIRMDNDHFVAADVLLLSTSEPNGLCYIETAELDGETNLKCRQCLVETQEMGQNDTLISAFDGEIVCETPNNILNKFEGTLTWGNTQYPLDNDRIILRGCVLRNTQWCYGVVIFAGKDTKLMQNSGKTKFKRTSIDRLLNFIIIGIVFFLLSLCLFCMVACGIWETLVGQYFQKYLPWDSLVPADAMGGATIIALLVFFSYAIVLNTVVPISLYVSVEVIRFVQSFFINWDTEMHHRETNTYAKARTTTLNEELGQIEYIFSDKTGTLTQNIMTFNKCSIYGISYGDVIDKITGEVVDITDSTELVDFSANKDYEENFKFYDRSLLDAVRGGEKYPQEFFRLLSLCHTVMAEQRNQKLEYQAQSPDEAALVSAARNFGFVFKERTPNTISIEVQGRREVYELLCILDFNNVRKRMSVILRKDGHIRLYCKGADSTIYARLRNGDQEIKDKTQDHLNKFAGEGLRTLCLACKDLDESYFNNWKARHQTAAIALDNREEKLDAIYEEIEKDLFLLGVTAIEDKLQLGVPQAIANLMMAGMKVWVLTGDKQETAINIGYSCNLISDDMAEIFIVEESSMEGVERELMKYRDSISAVNTKKATALNHSCSDDTFERYRRRSSLSGQASASTGERRRVRGVSVVTFSQLPTSASIAEEPEDAGFAIVINGHSLVHCLHPTLEELFIEVVLQCKSVICCRVTPLQKALVVELIKKKRGAVTLAIGDGANDVSMIKAAHVGVGISGQEGMQAVLASDYSIAQFRYLQRLLLVHGRWSYYRMCNFLRYFFYKNFAFTLCHFWYAFFCGFSGQTVFDPMFIAVYNLFYTSLPVLGVGIFDQDVNSKNSLTYPQLYKPGHKNLLFNKKEFFRSALYGCYTSLVLVLIPYGTYNDGVSHDGLVLSDYMLLGSVVATILVFVNTAQIALDTHYWTYYNHVMVWGSLATYFAMDYIFNYITMGRYFGSLTKAMSEATFWFTTVLALVVLLAPVLAVRFYRVDTKPTLTDRVRLKQRFADMRSKSQDVFVLPAHRRARRSIRSSYAFAHQEGFGRLITSGKIMRQNPSNFPFNFGKQGDKSNSTGQGSSNSTNSVERQTGKALRPMLKKS